MQIPSSQPKKEQGILVMAVLSVPACEHDQYPSRLRDWIQEEVRSACFEAPDRDREKFAASQPLTGVVAGIAFGYLERAENRARLAQVALACGDEAEVLRESTRVLSQHVGSLVVYDEAPATVRLLLARMLATGKQMSFDPRVVSRTLVDLSGLLTFPSARTVAPLHVVIDSVGLGPAPDPLGLGAVTSAFRRGARTVLGDELLARLEQTAALYLRCFCDQELQFEPLPYGGDVLET